MWWNAYLRIPFRDRGRDATGVDCWGLVRLIYKQELGINLPSYSECYGSTENKDEIAPAVTAHKQDWLAVPTPRPMDVILMRMQGVPMHVGVVTKPGYMIHATKGIGVCHERYDTGKWRSKIEEFARHQ